jgi:hypothetical protein
MDNVSDASNIGVLLVDITDGAPIGFIKFDPSGMLVYQVIKTGLHVFAFKPINKLLSEQWLKEPLYKKHAERLARETRLPDDILKQEAAACADFLNSFESPITLGAQSVKAQAVA